MDPEVKVQWIKALISGEYTVQLASENEGFSIWEVIATSLTEDESE